MENPAMPIQLGLEIAVIDTPPLRRVNTAVTLMAWKFPSAMGSAALGSLTVPFLELTPGFREDPYGVLPSTPNGSANPRLFGIYCTCSLGQCSVVDVVC